MKSDQDPPDGLPPIPAQQTAHSPAPEETGVTVGSVQPTPMIPTTQPPKPDWKYEDPSIDPDRKGLLLSNEIEKFCKNDLLIRRKDYKEEHLRPAAYTLTIGSDYVDSSGKIKKMKKSEPFFYMEPNSIVYVSTAEELNLPFYVAARFNLRVKWVYRGILLGTGPQVEPGFTGKLSCPLFNLTDRAVKIKCGDQFATIDFERTTAFCPGQNRAEIERQKKTLETLDEIRFGEERFLMFKQKPFPALKHLPDHDIVSSLVKLSDEVKTWRAIGIGTVVAFVGLTLTMLNFQGNLYRELRTTSQQVMSLQHEVDTQKNSHATQVPPLTGPSANQSPKGTSGKDIPK